MGHYDDAGTCVYCDYIRAGLRVRTRLVMETERFLAFHPSPPALLSKRGFLPKEHQASFGSITTNDSKEFSRVLKTILLKMLSRSE